MRSLTACHELDSWVYEDVANPVEVESLSFVDTPWRMVW